MEYFVMHVQTGKEAEIKHNIERHAELSVQGEVYFPVRHLNIRRAGKTVVEKKPVFPGYLFWITEQLSAQQSWSIRHIPGFFRFLGTGRTPQPLSGVDLDILGHFMNFGEVLGTSMVSFDENKRIKVASGPMMGLEGKIIGVDKRKRRARVRLDLYKSSFEIDFGFELLEADTKR